MINEEEIWKDIIGYEGYYQISNYGNIKNLITNKLVPQRTNKGRGYLLVNLGIIKKQKTFIIHRLVAKAFIDNPGNKPEVNHINGIKTDNRVENLEWVTHRENVQHAFRVLKRKAPNAGTSKIKSKICYCGKEFKPSRDKVVCCSRTCALKKRFSQRIDTSIKGWPKKENTIAGETIDKNKL